MYINARKKVRTRPAVYAARVRITSLLAVVSAVYSCGDVADLLQCRFYLHEVVDVELHGIAVLFPHFAGNEYSLMQRTLGLFQSGLQVVCGVLRVLHGHTSGSISRRNFLFANHVTKSFARNGRAHFRHTPYMRPSSADTKKTGNETVLRHYACVCPPVSGRLFTLFVALCRLFYRFRHSGRRCLAFSLARCLAAVFLGGLFGFLEAGEVRGEIHGVADSLCSGMDCLLEITV